MSDMCERAQVAGRDGSPRHAQICEQLTGRFMLVTPHDDHLSCIGQLRSHEIVTLQTDCAEVRRTVPSEQALCCPRVEHSDVCARDDLSQVVDHAVAHDACTGEDDARLLSHLASCPLVS